MHINIIMGGKGRLALGVELFIIVSFILYLALFYFNRQWEQNRARYQESKLTSDKADKLNELSIEIEKLRPLPLAVESLKENFTNLKNDVVNLQVKSKDLKKFKKIEFLKSTSTIGLIKEIVNYGIVHEKKSFEIKKADSMKDTNIFIDYNNGIDDILRLNQQQPYSENSENFQNRKVEGGFYYGLGGSNNTQTQTHRGFN